jgi:hypothetical protein
LFAPQLIEVPLRRAVVDLETGWVSAVAGRCIAMANHGDMTTLDESGPGFCGIIGGQSRRDN